MQSSSEISFHKVKSIKNPSKAQRKKILPGTFCRVYVFLWAATEQLKLGNCICVRVDERFKEMVLSSWCFFSWVLLALPEPIPTVQSAGTERSGERDGMGWEKENGWRAAGMENLTRVSFATSWKCLSEGRNGGLMLMGSVCGLTRPHMHAYAHKHSHTHTRVCAQGTSVLNHHCCLELSRGAQ